MVHSCSYCAYSTQAERLLLALAVASLWMLSVGSELEQEVTTLNVPVLTCLLLAPRRG